MGEKSFWKSKTIWFNVLMTILDIASLSELTGVVNTQALMIIHGVGNVVLRTWFTDTKLTM